MIINKMPEISMMLNTLVAEMALKDSTYG